MPGDGSYLAREVPLAEAGRQKILPAPYTVPVMKWQKDVIPGSDNICLFLDEVWIVKSLVSPFGNHLINPFPPTEIP